MPLSRVKAKAILTGPGAEFRKIVAYFVAAGAFNRLASNLMFSSDFGMRVWERGSGINRRYLFEDPGPLSAEKCLKTNVTTRSDGSRRLSSKPVFEYVPQCLQPILPVNLFALCIGSAIVSDAKFVDAEIALTRDLCTHFHFDAKIVS